MLQLIIDVLLTTAIEVRLHTLRVEMYSISNAFSCMPQQYLLISVRVMLNNQVLNY